MFSLPFSVIDILGFRRWDVENQLYHIHTSLDKPIALAFAVLNYGDRIDACATACRWDTRSALAMGDYYYAPQSFA